MSIPLRIAYPKLSPDAFQALISAKKILNKSPLGPQLVELVYLRVSQINGCAYCLEMHAAQLRAGGMADEMLDSVAGWRVSTRFSARERAALEWAESLTAVSETHAPDEAFEPLRALFTEVEISDLCFAIALMNALNRVAIGTRQ